MPTSPINGLPGPTDQSANRPEVDFAALNAVLDSRLVPRFTNATDRDSKITSPINGQLCWLDSPGDWYERRGGAWRPLTNSYLGDNFGADNSTDPNSATNAATVAITVPAGLPSTARLKTTASVYVVSPAGVGATVSVPGRSRTINLGPISSDITVTGYTTNLTAGARVVAVSVQTTVAGTAVTFRNPIISVEIV